VLLLRSALERSLDPFPISGSGRGECAVQSMRIALHCGGSHEGQGERRIRSDSIPASTSTSEAQPPVSNHLLSSPRSCELPKSVTPAPFAPALLAPAAPGPYAPTLLAANGAQGSELRTWEGTGARWNGRTRDVGLPVSDSNGCGARHEGRKAEGVNTEEGPCNAQRGALCLGAAVSRVQARAGVEQAKHGLRALRSEKGLASPHYRRHEGQRRVREAVEASAR